MIICLETATTVCSVALCNRNGVIAVKESNEERSHASQLTVFIEDILREAGLRLNELEAIAVSKGPGSYTGLRIGVSVAKGIAYASSLPLIGVDTPESIFRGFLSDAEKNYDLAETDLFCPSMDARRMEIYYSMFDLKGNPIKKICAEVITPESFNDIPGSSRIFFFGDGAGKMKEVLKRKNVEFPGEFRISAASMYLPAYKALDEKKFEDVAYFEPFYLKDFITSKPVKNILG